MKLNLGCGTDVRPGWINVDRRLPRTCEIVETINAERGRFLVEPPEGSRYGLPAPFTVWDLDSHPWPWRSEHADVIVAHHVVEHLRDPMGFFDEAHRVLDPNGRLQVSVPHAGSAEDRNDPTHRSSWTRRSFDYLTPTGPHRYTLSSWRIESHETGGGYTWPLAWHVEHYLGLGPFGEPSEHRVTLVPIEE